MRGYDHRSYGDGFADVYDDWYADVSDVAATVERVVRIAGPTGAVLELGVGTGRLAIPMAEAGLRVVGIDSSTSMLSLLGQRDSEARVETMCGDMVVDLPAGRFDAVLIAYNTIFNLLGDGEQQMLFERIAERLAPGGSFIVEAFVPGDDIATPSASTATSEVTMRSMTANQVVLSVSVNQPADQRAEGQFIQLSETGGVRLRPWSIRWATTAQLDAMASHAGLRLDSRFADMAGTEFTDDSEAHVSVYKSASDQNEW